MSTPTSQTPTAAPPISTAATMPLQPSMATQLALPSKLTKKILELEFIEMTELLPDTWRLQEEDSGCCRQRRSQQKGPVTDILVWVECYTSLVTVLASRYPSKTPDLMAYMKTIVKAHRSFMGEGWVSYDTCYRRKAAAMKSLDWGTIDFPYTTRHLWVTQKRCHGAGTVQVTCTHLKTVHMLQMFHVPSIGHR